MNEVFQVLRGASDSASVCISRRGHAIVLANHSLSRDCAIFDANFKLVNTGSRLHG